MKFSFSAYLKVLNLCKPALQKPAQEDLVRTVLGSLYPPYTDMKQYGVDKTTASLYINCGREIKDDFVKAVREVDIEQVKAHFKKRIAVPTMLSDRKYANVVLALIDLITKDGSIRHETVVDVVKGTKKNALRPQGEIVLSDFLAGVFLYIASPDISDEAKETVKNIDREYIESFSNRTQNIKFVESKDENKRPDSNESDKPAGTETIRSRSNALFAEHMKRQRFYMNRVVDTSILPDLIVNFRNESDSTLTVPEFLKWQRVKDADCVQIVGEGGTGKTTSLLEIWRVCQNNEYPIAIYVPLHEANNYYDDNAAANKLIGTEWISSWVYERYFKLSELNNGEMLKCLSVKDSGKRSFTLLLDGFNEISDKQKPTMMRQIRNIAETWANTSVILTSRHSVDIDFGYTSFDRINLAPLSGEQVAKYLADKNISKENIDLKLQNLLKNPMMLTIFCSTCNILNSAPSNSPFLFRIPFNTKGELIANHIEGLLFKHWAVLPITDREDAVFYERWVFYFVLTAIAYEMCEKETMVISSKGVWNIITKTYKIIAERKPWLIEWFFRYGHRNFPELIDNILCGRKEIDLSVDIQNYLETQFSLFLITDEKQKLWRFWHQDYRDCLAATHILNELMYSEYAGILPEILNRNYSNDVLKFMGELQLYSEGGEDGV